MTGKDYAKKYYAEHKEYFKAKRKAYYEKHREEAIEYSRNYYKQNLDKCRFVAHNRYRVKCGLAPLKEKAKNQGGKYE